MSTRRPAIDAGPADSSAWCAALNAAPHERATLTGDGGPAGRSGWIRYEHWTLTDGTPERRHGFVCPACRKITQSG